MQLFSYFCSFFNVYLSSLQIDSVDLQLLHGRHTLPKQLEGVEIRRSISALKVLIPSICLEARTLLCVSL